MTEYIASSVSVGRRPRIARMRWYSSSFSPSSANGCSASGAAMADSTVSYDAIASGTHETLQRGHEHRQPIDARTGQWVDGVLGVWHEPDDVARLVADPGDVAAAAIRVDADITEHDPAGGLELVKRRVVGDVLTLAVLERDHNRRPDGEL